MVNTFRRVNIHRPTEDQTAQAEVGQQYSRGARQLLEKHTASGQPIRSNLHGASKVFTGFLGEYFRGREKDQALTQRRAMIEALSGEQDLSPLERKLVASGDKGAIQQIMARRSATKRDNLQFDRQQQVAKQRGLDARALAEYKAKLAAQNKAAALAAKGPPTKTITDEYGATRLVQWNGSEWVPVNAGASPAAASAAADGGVAVGGAGPGDASSEQTAAPVPSEAPAAGQVPADNTKPLVTPTQDIPKGINLKKLSQERAKWLAKWEKESPEKRKKALNSYAKFKGDIAVVRDHLTSIAKLVDPDQMGKSVVTRNLPEASVGLVGSILSMIPGTEAANLKALLSQPFARFGFEELQSMRNNSPTGGSLGNVSNQEVKFLQNANTALSNNMSPTMFRKQLAKLMDITKRLTEQKAFEFETLFGSSPDAEIGARRGGEVPTSADAQPRKRWNAEKDDFE